MSVPSNAAMSPRQLYHYKITKTKNRNLALLAVELYGLCFMRK